MTVPLIITTINPPTEAVRAFAALDEIRLIAVGDVTTPTEWRCAGAEFLPVKAQDRAFAQFSRAVPRSHYARKMLGYAFALREDEFTPMLAETDDDNAPYPDWGFPDFQGRYRCVAEGQGFVNVLSFFTQHRIWPRGLPLRCIQNPPPRILREPPVSDVAIWNGLADLDPDVDAVYRLSAPHPDKFRFDKNGAVALGRGSWSPFNSQNTLHRRDAFALLYLPITVGMRFTGVLRSFVAQQILHHHNMTIGFTDASVYQYRNQHDPMQDFSDEIAQYLRSDEAMGIVNEIIAPALTSRSIPDQMQDAYAALTNAGITQPKEMTCLNAWLDTIAPVL